MNKTESLPYQAEAAVLRVMAELHPEIDRQVMRKHVRCALSVLHFGLMASASMTSSGAMGDAAAVGYSAEVL